MVATAITDRNVMILRAPTSDRVASRSLPSVEVRWAYGALWILCDDEESQHVPVHGEIGGRNLLFRARHHHVEILVYADVTDPVVCPGELPCSEMG